MLWRLSAAVAVDLPCKVWEGGGAERLSLVLPVYNEDGILRSNGQKLKALLGKLNVGYEIIICERALKWHCH